VSGGRSSFYWALRLMPAAKREGMFALYRYCRALDDIADEYRPEAEKLRRLAAWRIDVANLFDGGPVVEPAVAGLGDAIVRFGLGRPELLAIADGMEMDIRGEMMAPPLASLERYCYRVAGVVGLLAIKVFGADGEAERRFALILGDALQMTNILRDVADDAARGRVYLPREMLTDAGVAIDNPAAIVRHPALPSASLAFAGLARARYEAAVAALPADPRPLRPAVVMMAVYRRLLSHLDAHGYRPTATAVRVPERERLWIALRHMGPPATWPACI